MSFAVPVGFGEGHKIDFVSHLFFVDTHGRFDPVPHLGCAFSFLSSLVSSMMVALLMCHENMMNGLWIVDLIIWRC